MRSLGLVLAAPTVVAGTCRAQDDAADAHAWDAEIAILCEQLSSEDPDAVEAGLAGLCWIAEDSSAWDDYDEAAYRGILRTAFAPAAEPARALLTHRSPEIRCIAAEVALAAGLAEEALPVVVELAREPGDGLGWDARWLLTLFPPELAYPEWLRLVRDCPRLGVEHEAGVTAAMLDPEAKREVALLLSDPGQAARRAGLWGLAEGSLSGEVKAERCVACLADPDASVRVLAAKGVDRSTRGLASPESDSAREQAVDALVAVLQDCSDVSARREAASGLSGFDWLASDRADAVLGVLLYSRDQELRDNAVAYYRSAPGAPERESDATQPPPRLREALLGDDLTLRKRALWLIANIGGDALATSLVDELLGWLRDPDPWICGRAAGILRQVTWDSERPHAQTAGPASPIVERPAHASPSRVRAVLRAYEVSKSATMHVSLEDVLEHIGGPALPGIRAGLRSNGRIPPAEWLDLLCEVTRQMGLDVPQEAYASLAHPDAAVRATAITKLRRATGDTEPVVGSVLAIAESDPDPWVRATACEALPDLAEHGDASLAVALSAIADTDADGDVRAEALEAACEFHGADKAALLARALGSGDAGLMKWAAPEYRDLQPGPHEAPPALVSMLRDDRGRYIPWQSRDRVDGATVAEALLSLTRGNSPEAIAYCLYCLEHDAKWDALDVAETLEGEAASQVAQHSCALLHHRYPWVRERAADALGFLDREYLPPCVDAIRAALGDPSREVRDAAADALAWAVGEEALPDLRPLLREPNTRMAKRMLRIIDGLRKGEDDDYGEGDEAMNETGRAPMPGL